MPDHTPLLAIVYEEGALVAAIAASIVADWRKQGLRPCGLIEQHVARPGRRRCDMLLHELWSRERIAISEDRGSLARGCMLDADGLLRATALVRRALAAGAERAMFNKFGKSEAEGGGLRDTIAEAIVNGIPSVVFVPRRNLEDWRVFAGSIAIEKPVTDFQSQLERSIA